MDQIRHRQPGAPAGSRWPGHRNRCTGRGVRGLFEFGQCRGDDYHNGVTSVCTDFAGGNRGLHAQLRDLVTNAQYRVTNGTTLGRMRVAAIRTKIVVFTIDEFGTTRQDSLVLGDSTKARGK